MNTHRLSTALTAGLLCLAAVALTSSATEASAATSPRATAIPQAGSATNAPFVGTVSVVDGNPQDLNVPVSGSYDTFTWNATTHTGSVEAFGFTDDGRVVALQAHITGGNDWNQPSGAGFIPTAGLATVTGLGSAPRYFQTLGGQSGQSMWKLDAYNRVILVDQQGDRIDLRLNPFGAGVSL